MVSDRAERLKKVCVVLDNPGRDLLGLGLLASLLAEKGIRVLLVPMYDQVCHVIREQPDLVLVNYVRKANQRALRCYKELGIRIGVLDTEGGVLRCEYRELLNIVLNSGAKALIDDYFLWGTRQFRAFQEHLQSPSTNLHLTGCPRYDLYAHPWVEFIPDPPCEKREYVLFASSFPLNNPRFTTPDREIRNIQETMGLHEADLRLATEAANRAQQGFIDLVRKTCNRYPEMLFVLRPHPFEGDQIYFSALGDLSNLQIIREGSLGSWLKRSRLVVQLNSSVAFEAGLLGKPVTSLEMFQESTLQVKVASSCSVAAGTEEEFWEILDHVLAKRVSERVEAKFQEAKLALNTSVEDWIYKHDGKSSRRVAERLAKALESRLVNTSRLSPWFRRQLYEDCRFVLKLVVRTALRRTTLANLKMKRFCANDLAPLRQIFDQTCVYAGDQPLGSWWPFSKSNAVWVEKSVSSNRARASW